MEIESPLCAGTCVSQVQGYSPQKSVYHERHDLTSIPRSSFSVHSARVGPGQVADRYVSHPQSRGWEAVDSGFEPRNALAVSISLEQVKDVTAAFTRLPPSAFTTLPGSYSGFNQWVAFQPLLLASFPPGTHKLFCTWLIIYWFFPVVR